MNKKGGSVSILIKVDMRSCLLEEYSITDNDLECCVVRVDLGKRSLLVQSIYRPPNGNAKNFIAGFNRLQNKLKCYKQPSIIIGSDHNLDVLKHGDHKPMDCFLNRILDNNLIPCITRPTRITHSSATLIDNIFVSSKLYGKQTSSILVHDISDHLPYITNLGKIKNK